MSVRVKNVGHRENSSKRGVFSPLRQIPMAAGKISVAPNALHTYVVLEAWGHRVHLALE